MPLRIEPKKRTLERRTEIDKALASAPAMPAPTVQRPRRQLRGEAQRLELQARRRGAECETLVREVLGRPDRPWWLVRARSARRLEDKSGIDVVVYTKDLGRLFLQVKRSKLDVDNWLREHRNDPRPIALVVVRETEDRDLVYGRALGKLIGLRLRILDAQPGTPALLPDDAPPSS